MPSPDARLLDSFPEYPDLAGDSQRAAWTIEHVLNMTLGTEWNEDLPYSNPANSEIMMERASDRYRFILDRPIAHKPRAHWTYNGGCSALLGHLIAQGTGESLKILREMRFSARSALPRSNGTRAAAACLRRRRAYDWPHAIFCVSDN